MDKLPKQTKKRLISEKVWVAIFLGSVFAIVLTMTLMTFYILDYAKTIDEDQNPMQNALNLRFKNGFVECYCVADSFDLENNYYATKDKFEVMKT